MNTCSLLIPCHNAAEYLPRLWRTVTAQTVPFDEIICYDDGSSDRTADVARELGAKVLRGDVCRGAAYARNQLARATQCPWFHFHDADDLLHPNYLERVKGRISSDIDVVLCNVDWIDSETQNLVISWKYEEYELRKDPVNYTLTHSIGGINGLYRKDTFFKVGGFDELMHIWEDADLHIRLANIEAKFGVVEEVLSISLREPSSTSHNYQLNFRYRFDSLKKYAVQLSSDSTLAIANQAEILAKNFLNIGDKKMAREVVKFCQSLGGNPPTTNNFILKILKSIFPALWILQLQNSVRSLKIST